MHTCPISRNLIRNNYYSAVWVGGDAASSSVWHRVSASPLNRSIIVTKIHGITFQDVVERGGIIEMLCRNHDDRFCFCSASPLGSNGDSEIRWPSWMNIMGMYQFWARWVIWGEWKTRSVMYLKFYINILSSISATKLFFVLPLEYPHVGLFVVTTVSSDIDPVCTSQRYISGFQRSSPTWNLASKLPDNIDVVDTYHNGYS